MPGLEPAAEQAGGWAGGGCGRRRRALTSPACMCLHCCCSAGVQRGSHPAATRSFHGPLHCLAGSLETSLNLTNPLGYAEQISIGAEYGTQSTNVYTLALTKPVRLRWGGPRPGVPATADLRLHQLFHDYGRWSSYSELLRGGVATLTRWVGTRAAGWVAGWAGGSCVSAHALISERASCQWGRAATSPGGLILCPAPCLQWRRAARAVLRAGLAAAERPGAHRVARGAVAGAAPVPPPLPPCLPVVVKELVLPASTRLERSRTIQPSTPCPSHRSWETSCCQRCATWRATQALMTPTSPRRVGGEGGCVGG